MANIDAKMALMQALIRGPSHTLDLIDLIKEKSRGKMLLSQAAAYVALRQMEAEGFVTAYEDEENVVTRGRPRRLFKLTATGRRVALEDQASVAGLFDLVPAKVRAMVAMFFGEVP